MSASVAPEPQVLQRMSQLRAQKERAAGRDASAPVHELPDMQSELHEPDEDEEDEEDDQDAEAAG